MQRNRIGWWLAGLLAVIVAPLAGCGDDEQDGHGGIRSGRPTALRPPAQAMRIYSLGALPTTSTDCRAYADRHCQTPEGAAAATIASMLLYTRDKRSGTLLATMILSPDRLRQGRVWNGHEPGQHVRDLYRQLDTKPYIARSYATGTSPGTGYRLPRGPVEIGLTPSRHPISSPEQVKLFVQCTGADTPRPITLIRGKDGRWRVQELSSLFVGIRAPR